VFLAALSCSGYIFAPFSFQGHALSKTIKFPLFFAQLAIAGLLSNALAQEIQSQSDTLRQSIPSSDSLIIQSIDTALSAADSIDAAPKPVYFPDTLGRMSTPSLVGTYDRSLDSTRLLTTEDLRWLDYRYLGGILETHPGVYIRDQSSEGQYSQINIRGQDWRSIAITSDGRLLNDPISGIYNLYYFTTEYADRIEIITGPRAFLYGLNSTGGAVNLLTKNYNSNVAFSKINYSETAYEYQYSDGTFTQNISRKVNITFGFQHQSTDGRFPGNAHRAWNMRAKVRYNLSRNFNIILSEYLTNTKTQLNGGVDTLSARFVSAFDPLTATMRNTDTFEKINRHDVDLSLVGTIFGDTANVSMLTLYYSNSFREYRDAENVTIPNGVFIESDHTSSWMGAQLIQNINSKAQRLSFGSTLEIRQIEGSPNLGRRRNVIGSAWVKEELLINEAVTVAGFGRYDRYLEKDYFGLGADATFNLADGVSLFGGLSFSRRLPTYQELYWTDSTVSRLGSITAEKHRQGEIGAHFTLHDLANVRLAYFHRTVEDAIGLLPFGSGFVFPGILFSNVDKTTTDGIEARIAIRWWLIYLDGVGTFLVQKSGGNKIISYPKVSANGGIYFWNKILDDKLDLKIGFRGRYTSSQVGFEFNPEVLAYVANRHQDIGLGSSVDAFLIAHIGDAYLHFIWENLTNQQYFATPFYPVRDRAIRIGVSWEFLN
jgi:iron complex outermembrane receptor protein